MLINFLVWTLQSMYAYYKLNKVQNSNFAFVLPMRIWKKNKKIKCTYLDKLKKFFINAMAAQTVQTVILVQTVYKTGRSIR